MSEQEPTTSDERLLQLKRWIIDEKLDISTLYVASSDASFRRYFRLGDAEHSLIVMDAPPEHNDNILFIEICDRLDSVGLRVPNIIKKDLYQGFLLLKDLGSVHYLDVLIDNNVKHLYSAAISCLLIMQSRVDTGGIPKYDAAMIRFELDIFPDWYIQQYKQKSLSHKQKDTVEEVIMQCINTALEQPNTFVHRDFHSRNLMYMKDQLPGILDFQGAVDGPITYDIVSLLKDCYISWPDEIVYRLLEGYRLQLVASNIVDVDRKTFERWFDFMGLQRHLKVLGIFCRLKIRDNKPDYMNDVPRVLGYVMSVCNKYPELAQFRALMQQLDTNPLKSESP